MTKEYAPIADCRMCPICRRAISNVGWHSHVKAHVRRGQMTMHKELGPYGPRWVWALVVPEAQGETR